MNSASEDKLQNRLSDNRPEERKKWAREWKKSGKKVIGIVDFYLPEEIFYAGDILPWRLTGTWNAFAPLSKQYQVLGTDVSCVHITEALLSGEYDFLDGAIFTDWDDDVRRMNDVVSYAKATPYTHIIYIPRIKTDLACRYFAQSLKRLITELEKNFSVLISNDSLQQAIELCGETRTLLKKVYQLKSKKVPPLSGSETLELVTASLVMPKEIFNRELSEIMPYLKERKTSVGQNKPRLLVASDRLDHPGYLKLIEDAGSIVVMDDFDTGSRYAYSQVTHGGEDLVYSLAKSSINRPACPRMTFYDKHVEEVIKWVKEYNVDGVINLPHNYGYSRLYTAPYFRDRLNQEGISVTTFRREYHLANEGQLKTRVGAFLEMITNNN